MASRYSPFCRQVRNASDHHCRNGDGGRPPRFAPRLPMPGVKACRCQRNHPDDCNVLIVIGHQRIFHEAHVFKAQHRHKRHAKKSPGKQQRPAPTLPISPQHSRNGQGRRKRQPPERIARIDVPLRINKNKIQRQQRFVKVEPHHAARPQQSICETGGPICYFLAMRLEPHVHCRKRHGNRKKWTYAKLSRGKKATVPTPRDFFRRH